jgi:hypothetical protein
LRRYTVGVKPQNLVVVFELFDRLLEQPDILQEVLRRLGAPDLASLAGAARGCAAAVAATALMKWAKDEKNLPPRRSTYYDPAPRLCWREACSLAARGGHLEVVKWLDSTGCPRDDATGLAAAAGGHLEVLKWLHSVGGGGARTSSWTCAVAAEGGHLEVLKWLHTTGYPCDSMTCYAAALGGRLEVLKWLHSAGCPWDSVTCYAAAWGGHLEMLKWLHSTGCPRNSETCYTAAFRGHLEVLKWLHNTGCPWDSATCYAAARGGYLEVLKWLHSAGCPWDEAFVRGLAAAEGHQEMTTWLDGLAEEQ